jgi:hypothetical protein
MPTTVKIRRSGTASATPSALEHGEIAINYADGKVFWKNASDVITSFTFQSYALASHTHSISDVTGLQTALDGKASSSHAHSISDVTGLQTALDGKAASSHTHSISDVTGLQTALDGKASSSHTHAASDITSGTLDIARIANDAVTYAKIQNVSATDRLLGRSSAGAGDVEEITCTSFGRSLISSADAAAARTTLSVQPTASPTFTGTAIVSGTFQVKANSGSLSHAFGYNENGGEISLYTTSEVQASLIDHVGGTGTRVLELVNGNDLYLGLGSGNTTGNVKIQRAGYVTAVTVSSTGTATFAGQIVGQAGAAITGNATITASSGIPLTLNGNSTALRIEEGAGETIDIYRNVSDGLCYFDANQQTFSGFVFRTTPTGGSVTTRLTISSTGTATFTGQILADDIDSANSVAYGFDGDPDTGIGRGGANVLTLVTGGVEAVTLNSGQMLLCRKGFALQGEARPSSGAGLEVNYVSASNAATIGAYDRTNNVYKELHLFGSVIDFQIGAGSDMRLDANGYLLIGYTASNGAYRLQVNSQIYATNATVATSDARFKTNVESLTDATSVIESLRPVAFDFIPQADRNFAAERQVGLIAQEAQAALAGTDYADSVVAQCGDHLGLAYEKLVPVLIKALQESNARIAALEERING